MQIVSFSSFGYEGEIIKVEADLRRGLPVTEIVGLPGSAVKEAKERVRVSIRNSGLEFPAERILINLSPADQKKDGTGFDLPIAISILTAKDNINDKNLCCENKCSVFLNTSKAVMIIGELELSGNVRPVRGVLGAISAGVKAGLNYFIVPKENQTEALIYKNANIFGASNLIEALNFFYDIENFSFQNNTEEKSVPVCDINDNVFVWTDNAVKTPVFDDFPIKGFEDIRGQDLLIRSIEIAAAGGHNLLAYGPPGCGKTLSLSRFQLLLPDMPYKTALETTKIYSVAGLLPSDSEENILLKRPPFRMPHQNASLEGMIGGSGKCMPGEVSLAHGGVLFLDEASHFKACVLQTLRAPLETGCVTLSRAGRKTSFPARFQLLLAVNPCPCGNLGTKGKVCTCMPHEIERYWKKLTAPLLDRIDIRIHVEPPITSSLLKPSVYSTEKLRDKIKTAKQIQFDRAKIIYKEDSKIQDYKNAYLLPSDILKICKMTDEAEKLFYTVVQKLSGRGSHAVLKIARTIADIDNQDKINSSDIEEAASFRKWANYLPDFL